MAQRPTGPPGLDWHPLRPGDLAELSGLMTAIEALDEPAERHSLAELEEGAGEAGFDAAGNTLVGRDSGGMIVAYGWNHPVASDVDPRRVYLTGGVHPGWRRAGVGSAVLRWQLEAAREWYARTRQEGFGPLHMLAPVDEAQADQRRLYERHGLEPVRWLADMVLRFDGPPPAPVAVPGITVVPLTEDLLEPVRAAHNEAFADDWGSQPVDEVHWAEQLSRSACRLGWSWVALDAESGEVAGYCTNSAYEADWAALGFSEGWTDRLGVRRRYRARGIATSLLAHSMRSFYDAGLEAAGLGVDSDSSTGAFQLYAHLGYTTTSMTVVYARTESAG